MWANINLKSTLKRNGIVKAKENTERARNKKQLAIYR